MLTKAVIKDIQSLQQKKQRDLAGLFVAEGPKLVFELFESGVFELQHMYVTQELTNPSLSAMADEKRVTIVTPQQLKQLSGLQTPNEMLAVFHQKRNTQPVPTENGVSLLLEDIQDPGNLGTIIRSADWFGVRSIICSPSTVDAFNPKVVQSTMASLARVQILYTELGHWINEHRTIPLVVTSIQGNRIQDVSIPTPCALLIGNESKGVSTALQSLADYTIRIPGSGTAESLNAGVAASICLYQICQGSII
ncbi:MAG: TrmH family RNA methyltransferase [Ferruginibacter sp.]